MAATVDLGTVSFKMAVGTLANGSKARKLAMVCRSTQTVVSTSASFQMASLTDKASS